MRYLPLVCPIWLVACTGSGTPLPEARLAIGVAPLTLSGVSDACYGLEVFAGTPGSGALVWQRGHLCASQFGDAEGSLAYVGTCDAGPASVRLVMEDLCQGGACAPVTPGATSLPASAWKNPCPAPDGCVQTTTCLPNADVPVRFDLTVARSASQGFFDVAVTFADIFCSAKLDCLDDEGGPLTLLHDPGDDVRKQTAVVAWACTAGTPGDAADTWLYYDNVVLRCFDGLGAELGAWPYDPSLGPGNVGPGAAPFVFQSATYRSVTPDTGVASWSMAFGLDVDALPGRCVLEARATASEGALGEYTTKGVYPYVAWSVELSSGVDTLSCTRHRMDVAGSGVRTAYATTPKAFSHAMRAQGQAMSRRGAELCGDTIAALSGQAAFTASPEGLTARVGASQSPFYALPSGWALEGCCGDPCCE